MKLFTACSSKSAYILKLASIGMTLTILGALILFCDPVKLIVDSQLTLRTGSLLYNLWLKPPIDVFVSVYMFNVTNLEEFIRGIDTKLKVAEVGPYVYQEVLTNNNVTFNANDTVTYTPRRDVTFVRGKSIGDPKVDRIIAANIPYMGATTNVASMSTMAALSLSALTTQLKSKPMLKMSVHDYLWGYDDNLVHLASKIVPSFVPFKRFGILERLFDEGDNEVTMKLPSREKKQKNGELRDYALYSWNGGEKIKFWSKQNENATRCNTIRGSYDGTLFPRNITKGETFRIYRKAFCRNLPITYSHPGKVDGVEAYFFKLEQTAFDSDANDVNSSCFCPSNKCLKKGLGSIMPCYYNMPLAISFPHFFNGDPAYQNSVNGLSPNESKHGSEVIIQPQLGIPMRVHTRFQVNLLIDDVKFNRDINVFRKTVLPILWAEISVDELKPELKMLLTLLFKICPYVQCAIISILIVAGLALVGASLFQWVQSTMPATTVIPSSNGGIIIIPSEANVVNNISKRKFKKPQKEMLKTMAKKQFLLDGTVTKTNVCIIPLISPQQPQLEHHQQPQQHRHHHHHHHHGSCEKDQQQLLPKDNSTLLLPECMTC